MEQSPANQLPEADSLPDGFVESSTEPSIPISETEKQQHSSDYKDTFIDVGRSQTQIDESIPDTIPSPNRNRVHETGFKEDETRSPDSRADKAEKPRTFPVPLSEKGSFDSDLGLVRAEDEEKRQGVAPIAIEPGSNRSNGVEERLENSEQSAEGCTESHDTAIKEKSASESTERLKNKKLDYAVVDDERKKWVLQSLGKKYRDYKKDIKDKYYSLWNTDEERLQHRPPDVSSEDWAWLVQYWGSPEVQAVAVKNKANRSSQKLRHTGGTKSFARHRDEEMMSRTDGSIPSRADLFIRTHSRKDGTPVDEKSTEIISKFKELSAAQEGGSFSSIGDDIYTQVMGAERHGRVRGYGLGPTPTLVFGSTSRQSQAAFDEVQIELSSMHEKLQQMEEWKKNQEEEKRQMEEWKKKQEEEKRAHLEEMKLLHAIIAEMRQRLSPRRQDPSEGGAD